MKFRKESIFVLATVLLASLAIAQTKSATQTAKAKTIHQDEFFIVGIEARTSAAKETSGEGVIPTQWQKFAVEGVLAKIPNKADQNVYQVYTDFANKRYGEYSVVLGARVADKSHVPAGLVLKTIPAGKYAIFQSDKGPADQVIAAAWQKIADAEDQGKLGYIRTYKADYEMYEAQAMDPQNLRGELHVGVK